MQVSIQTAHLKAAACFSGDQDVRYYLNGVLAEVRPGETRLAATDGNIIGVLRDVVTSGEQPDMPDVIIPNATIKLALQSKSTTLVLAFDGGKWSLAGIAFTPCDGIFPDYRRVIPRGQSGEPGMYNFDYLARIAKAAKALGVRTSPIIRHNGADTAQVSIYGREDEFVGAISPMRFTEKFTDLGMPQWGGDRRPPIKAVPDYGSDLA